MASEIQATTVRATNLKANDGTASLAIANSSGAITASGGIAVDTISEKTSANGVAIDGLKVKDSALVTDTNKYPFVKSGELNSLGYLNHNFFGSCYYLSTTKACTHNAWTEVDGTWTKKVTSGASGSDDADPFGKFASGRWTPTVSGYYLAYYQGQVPNIDSGEVMRGEIRVNSATTNGVYGARNFIISSGANYTVSISSCGIFPLDTNDYLSLWILQNGSGSPQNLVINVSQIGFAYLGTSDL